MSYIQSIFCVVLAGSDFSRIAAYSVPQGMVVLDYFAQNVICCVYHFQKKNHITNGNIVQGANITPLSQLAFYLLHTHWLFAYVPSSGYLTMLQYFCYKRVDRMDHCSHFFLLSHNGIAHHYILPCDFVVLLSRVGGEYLCASLIWGLDMKFSLSSDTWREMEMCQS